MKIICSFLTSPVLIFVAWTAEASITMDSTYVQADVKSYFSNYTFELFNGSTIPTHTTLNAIDDGDYSKNSIDWYISGGQTIFSIGVDHKRDGTFPSYAETFSGPLVFTTNSNEPYELSGFYNVTDVGASGFDCLYVSLYDESSGFVFYNYQQSFFTPNEQFVLGGTGGDSWNDLFSSLTGNLIAGHTYQLYYQFGIQAYPDADSGASALGNVTLKIGARTEDETAATPEPLSAMIWIGLAITAITVAHRGGFARI